MYNKLCLYFVLLLPVIYNILPKYLNKTIICNISGKDKKDCGYVGITQDKCEDKGCCFKKTNDGTPWCYNTLLMDDNIIYYQEERNNTSNETNEDSEDNYVFLELDPLLPEEVRNAIKKNPDNYKKILGKLGKKKNIE